MLDLDKATYVIYQASNNLNNHSYIGATIFDMPLRKKVHLRNAFEKNGRTKFYQALRKHGAENFTWKVIGLCLIRSDLMKMEQEFIAEIKPEYNMTAGGDGIIAYKITDECRKKISIASRRSAARKRSLGIPGPARSEETKRKLSNHFKGKPRSEEVKAKIRLAWIKRKEKQC